MKKFNFWPLITVVCFWLGYYAASNIDKIRYDMPEEFNEKTVSTNEMHPTKMEVIYSKEERVFLFRFAKNNN